IGHHQDDGAGTAALDVGHDAADDIGIDTHQVIAAHARLAGHARSHQDEVGSFHVLVVVTAGHPGVETHNGSALGNIQGDTLGQVFDDVDQQYVRVVPFGDGTGGRGAHGPRTDNTQFLPHNVLFSPLR